MVNYHDPATIAQEFGACPFPSRSSSCSPTKSLIFSTAALVKLWHVVDGIYMCVSLSYRASRQALLDYLTVTLRF
jgi:hypothetical protein